MLTKDQFADIATLARLGLKVIANDDKMSPGQIAGAAQTLDAFVNYANAEVEKAKNQESKDT